MTFKYPGDDIKNNKVFKTLFLVGYTSALKSISERVRDDIRDGTSIEEAFMDALTKETEAMIEESADDSDFGRIFKEVAKKRDAKILLEEMEEMVKRNKGESGGNIKFKNK